VSVKIEGVLDGYELVRIGSPQKDESYIDTSGRVKVASCAMNYDCWARAIVRKIKPPYSERQAEWVKEHDVKVGDTVKVLRMFDAKENGFIHYSNSSMKQHVGVKYKVTVIGETAIVLGDYWWPYFVLEKCVPVTRPMTRDEFLAAWKQRGFCPLIDADGVITTVFAVDTGTKRCSPIETTDDWFSLDKLKSWKFASDESPISVTEN
jgi:hypothetical protein